jgi:ankyrin repeat protein
MQTFFQSAMDGEYDKVLQYLNSGVALNCEDENKNTALFYACRENFGRVVDLLVHKGASVNQPCEFGITPFIEAINMGNYKIALFLYKHGANVNAQDYYGNTAIMEASISGDLKAVKLLIKWKANLEIRNTIGESALSLAICENNSDTVSYLKLKGAVVGEIGE